MGAGPRRSKGVAGATETSIQEALRRYTQQTPLPFAISRGAKHTLVYANSAFLRLSDGGTEKPLGKSIAAVVSRVQRQALLPILDRAFREGVELHDIPLEASADRVSSWLWSAADRR